jgi:hypothetical protein
MTYVPSFIVPSNLWNDTRVLVAKEVGLQHLDLVLSMGLVLQEPEQARRRASETKEEDGRVLHRTKDSELLMDVRKLL